MEILLTKVASQLVYPLNFSLMLAIVAGLLLWRRWNRIGGALLAFAVAWLWLWSTPVFTDKVRASLEQLYLPIPVEKMESADAIVVLGGGTVDSACAPRIYPDLGPATDRVWHAARLYRAHKAPWLVLSGGPGITPTDEMEPESKMMVVLLKDFGIPESAILTETVSRNTYENAIFSKPILDAHGIKKVLLVTSALHMRRAKAIFDSLGIETIPAPTDYEVIDRPEQNILRWLPEPRALEGGTRAFKEYLGAFVFHLRGR